MNEEEGHESAIPRSLEMTGRTVDEAVIAALEELGVESDEVKVEVIGEGSRGLFGLGGRYVKVRVTEVDQKERWMRRGRRFLEDVVQGIGVDLSVDGRVQADGSIFYDLRGSRAGLLIGRRGQTLDALQLLVRQFVSKVAGERVRVLLDAEGYRQRRAMSLSNLARRVAQEVRQTGRPVTMEPMNAAERRIVHVTLSEDPSVETHSEGKDPFRRVVVTPVQTDRAEEEAGTPGHSSVGAVRKNGSGGQPGRSDSEAASDSTKDVQDRSDADPRG